MPYANTPSICEMMGRFNLQGKDVSENHVAHSGGPRNSKDDANAMYAAATKMFKMAGVQLRQFKPSRAVHVDLWA